MALLTKKTPSAIANRVIKDYRNACQPMAVETTPEIFYMFKVEDKLLPQLKLKLFLINVDYIPTNEESLKQFAKNGYEVHRIKGTCHYPMLENPDELNKSLEAIFHKISKSESTIFH